MRGFGPITRVEPIARSQSERLQAEIDFANFPLNDRGTNSTLNAMEACKTAMDIKTKFATWRRRCQLPQHWIVSNKSLAGVLIKAAEREGAS